MSVANEPLIFSAIHVRYLFHAKRFECSSRIPKWMFITKYIFVPQRERVRERGVREGREGGREGREGASKGLSEGRRQGGSQ